MEQRNIFLISRFPIFFLFVMLTCPISGQEELTKQLVERKDFDMWSTLRFPQISDDGKWISYHLDYEQMNDTLVVIDMDNRQKFEMPNGHSGKFLHQETTKYFVFQDNNKGVGVLNLNHGNIDWVQHANQFDFTSDGRYLACFYTARENGFLKLFDLSKQTSIYIKNLQYFAFSPNGQKAALSINDSAHNTIQFMDLGQMVKAVILKSKTAEYKNFAWSQLGNKLAFIEKDREKMTQRLYCFADNDMPHLSELGNSNKSIAPNAILDNGNLFFSDDETTLFFYKNEVGNDELVNSSDTIKVQVWKGTDKWIYPRQKMDWEYNKTDWLYAWWPKTGRLMKLGNRERPDVFLTGDQKHALSFNVLTYEPQYKQIPQSDFYITSLKTGQSKSLIKKLETGSGYLKIAPNGKFVAYFKENNWWIYDIDREIHLNLTAPLKVSLIYKHPPFSTDPIPFGMAGWSTNNEILVYDEFDIWVINTEGTLHKRITNGRENHLNYRLYDNIDGKPISFRWPTYDSYEYNLETDNFLEIQDEKFNLGYAVLNKLGEIEPFIAPELKNTRLRKASSSNSFVYIKESNSLPPVLIYRSPGNVRELYQSNSHQDKFLIGKTELVSYRNKQDENLKGLLHYPDNYTPGKKYPMIVHIYELLSSKYHTYVNPGDTNGDGFNYRNFTAKGYFVLEPDILIQKGNPGLSALDCVIEATNLVVQKHIVDKSKIGLIGHSFGGYETAFIISQTNLFSTAVVGAGVYDIIGLYHSVSEDYGKQQLWRFESQQWRMGKSFYEDRDGYYKNSPMHNAQNIRTPTLIWTGNKDHNLNWHQSEQMYLSLRRLGIPVELLIYEDEGHSLTKLENQKDLSRRIEKWMDTHLKNR